LPIVLLFIISSIVYFSINNQEDSKNWVEHTHKVISEGQQLIKLIVDMETGERGFLITGKEHFLEPFNAAKVLWDKKLPLLKELVSDNTEQVKRLEEIEILQKKWLKDAAEIEISTRRQVEITAKVTIDDVRILIERETGKSIIDKIRYLKDEFIEVEEKLMAKRLKSQKKAEDITRSIVI